MGLKGVGVLLLAGDGMFVGNEFSGHAHVLIIAGAPEAVFDHGVDNFGVAHAKALAALRKQVGSVGHGLHTAGDDDLSVAEHDSLSAK